MRETFDSHPNKLFFGEVKLVSGSSIHSTELGSSRASNTKVKNSTNSLLSRQLQLRKTVRNHSVNFIGRDNFAGFSSSSRYQCSEQGSIFQSHEARITSELDAGRDFKLSLFHDLVGKLLHLHQLRLRNLAVLIQLNQLRKMADYIRAGQSSEINLVSRGERNGVLLKAIKPVQLHLNQLSLLTSHRSTCPISSSSSTSLVRLRIGSRRLSLGVRDLSLIQFLTQPHFRLLHVDFVLDLEPGQVQLALTDVSLPSLFLKHSGFVLMIRHQLDGFDQIIILPASGGQQSADLLRIKTERDFRSTACRQSSQGRTEIRHSRSGRQRGLRSFGFSSHSLLLIPRSYQPTETGWQLEYWMAQQKFELGREVGWSPLHFRRTSKGIARTVP